MPVEKTDINQFLSLAKLHPVMDVRSPGEYLHAHIPGAYSLPLFTDEERAVIGTAYKQRSREEAVNLGLGFFGPNMKPLADKAKAVAEEFYQKKPNTNDNIILVHCWRGGMRSGAVAWLLDLYGYKVYVLSGGYKNYRKWVLDSFSASTPYTIIGGNTGSGKTELLQALKEKGEAVVDLEGLAIHKGSAFGAIGLPKQPGQEMFENLLAMSLKEEREKLAQGKKTIFLEDESQRIGLVNIPGALWDNMRKTQLFFLDIPFEKRLDHIIEGYGSLNKEELLGAIDRIKEKLGGQNAKLAKELLEEGKTKECFEILLSYYDKLYLKSLNKRENLKNICTTIVCENVGSANVNAVLSQL
jgi:tRNA 2-selenouridine synthase